MIILGLVAITITVAAPQVIWGTVTRYLPMALFGIQRPLVLEPVEQKSGARGDDG